MNKYFLSLLIMLCFILGLVAQESADIVEEEPLSEEQIAILIDSVEQTINYVYGKIEIMDGEAYIDVPEGFKFVGGEQSNYILTDLWGNPPSETMPEGMLIPKESGVLGDNMTYAIEVTYSEDGYIEDDDAKEIDYNELLESMQEDSKAENEYRTQEGYPTVDIVGWASQPYYDESSKKLHWAKELKFQDYEINTLNYNIRVLGRKGYINLNAISDMPNLSAVKSGVPKILDAVHFNSGYAYDDFQPGVDKIAAYGISGLIAGKILAKAGLLAKFGIVLAKFWKIIAIGLFGGLAFLRNIFSRRKEENQSGPVA